MLQGLDAGRPDAEPQILDKVDYLSTVSGGGYMGTALVWGLMQSRGRFPFTSKLDQDETIETKHLRDYSNYLAPNGFRDVVEGVLALSRGLVINAIIFLVFILAAAAVTVAINPARLDLALPGFHRWLGDGWTGHIFLWTGLSGGTLAALAGGLVIFTTRFGWQPDLAQRERLNKVHLALFAAWLVIFVLELQAYVLSGIFEATDQRNTAHDGNVVTLTLSALSGVIAKGWPALLSGAVALVASVSKLTAVVKATLGDRSWSGSVMRWASKAAVYVAALIVPLLLWSAYLLFCYWGIGNAPPSELHEHTPGWLQYCANIFPTGYNYTLLYLSASLGLLIVALLVKPNAGSLHSYYRDRLSRAFLWDLTQLRDGTVTRKGWSSNAADTYTFDRLKPFSTAQNGGRDWHEDVRFAPYLIVNTAVNLEGSEELNRRGRNADSFIFSPLFAGSETTGYTTATRLKELDRNINIGTALAISGAAASANMGASTIKALTFTLSAVNIRLGYWLPNPRRIPSWTKAISSRSSIGLPYFVYETFGWINEQSPLVYLTDGGHYDNLGLYELIKRRCKLIIVVDAEADPVMNFDSLVRLQRYARIDLGVLIDLPWPRLKAHALQVTADATRGPAERTFARNGPHVAIGHIKYSEADSGVLLYVKACLSGDESDLVRDYKRRNADFPHETTVDQFFSEEQFEVYRSLGFHIMSRMVTGEDDVAIIEPDIYPAWLSDLQRALRSINISDAAVDRIMTRAEDAKL